MGLSVRAYKNIQKIECGFNEDGEPVDKITGEYIDCFQPYIEEYFKERATDLQHKSAYSYESVQCFYSRSYGTYNRWREELAKLAGYTAVYDDYLRRNSHQVGAFQLESGPFWELCCFSDCEGVIGNAVCRKLAKDFVENEDKARAIGTDFYEVYLIWKNTFEYAVEGGAVQFS